MAVPEIIVQGITPTYVEKPITTNNVIDIDYEVIDNGTTIAQMVNTFKLEDFSVEQTLNPSRRLVVDASTSGGWVWNTSISFNVTDANFQLISFKFYIRDVAWGPTIRYVLNGSPLQDYPSATPGWLEYVFPTPMLLNPGTHTIQIQDIASGDFSFFTTTVRPVISGMAFTSTTIFRMEMDFNVAAINPAGVDTSLNITRYQTARLTLDDDISTGEHPLSFTSIATLQGGAVHNISGVGPPGSNLKVSEMEMPDFTVHRVIPSIVGKPVTNDNNEIAVVYEILNDEIHVESAVSTFTIDTYSIIDSIASFEMYELPAVGSISRSEGRVELNITDSDFRIRAFRVWFNQFNLSSTQNIAMVIGTQEILPQIVPPGLRSEGWMEWVFDTPMVLNPGNIILGYTNTSWNSLPVPFASGMFTADIPGGTVSSTFNNGAFRLQLEYTLSDSGVHGEQTAIIKLDNNIDFGKYPVEYETNIVLNRGVVHTVKGTTGNLLTITTALPKRDDEVSVSSVLGTGGNMQPLVITFTNVIDLEAGDMFVIQIFNQSNDIIYTNSTALVNPTYTNLCMTVSADDLDGFGSGLYAIRVFIQRGAFEHGLYEFDFLIEDISDNVIVHNITPVVIQKPINRKNNLISIDHEIAGDVTRGRNVFTIGAYSSTKDELSFIPYRSFMLEPPMPLTQSAFILSSPLSFTVHDSEFRLIGIKFLVAMTDPNPVSISIRVAAASSIITAGTVYTFSAPSGIQQGGWIEYTFPEPMVFTGVGTRAFDIRVLNATGGTIFFRSFVSPDRPVMPELSITSITAHTWEVIFSSSNTVVSERNRASQIILGDTIPKGLSPVMLESEMTLGNSGNTHTLIREVGTLEVLESNSIEIGSLELNFSGRYIDSEADIVTTVTGIKNVYPGDTITISLKNESTIFLSHTDILAEGQEIYIYTIVASEFVGLDVGEYEIEADITRGLGSLLISAPYDVIEKPTIYMRTMESFELVPTDTSMHGTEFTTGFAVTAPGLRLFGIKYFLGELSGTHTLELGVNNTTLHRIEFPTGIAEGWVEIKLPEPVDLDVGNHNIQLYCQTGIVLHTSEARPRTPGFAFDDNSVYAIGMDYMVVPNPIHFLAPFTNPVTIQTPWVLFATGENTVTGTVNISGTGFSGTYDAIFIDTSSFKVDLRGINTLSASSHSISYSFNVAHEEYGSASLMAFLPDRVVVLGSHLHDGNNINLNPIFANVESLEERSYSLGAIGLYVVSNQYGTVPINIIYDNVLSVRDIPLTAPAIQSFASDVEGRYSDSEIDNRVNLQFTDVQYIAPGDIARITLRNNDTILYSHNIALISPMSTYVHVIPASAFIGLPVGTYTIRVELLRGTRILAVESVIYRVVVSPSVIHFLGFGIGSIQLPIFTPMNIISSFVIQGVGRMDAVTPLSLQQSGLDSIVGNVVFNGVTYTNTSFDSNGNITIAFQNIYDMSPGTYSIDTSFTVNSKYGTATMAQSFSNVLTVFPHIQTEGIETRYTYDLILCMPNKTQLEFIEAYDIVYNPMFLQYNKLTFSIYREIVTEDYTTYLNPVWGKILSDALVLMNKRINERVIATEYFVIENPNISYDGLDQLSFQAYSYEKIFLNNLDLSGWRDSVKRLYDPTNRTGDDGLPHGILNYILTMKWHNVWTLRHVDGTVLERERVLSFTGNNMRFVVDTLEESFNCVFVFDNVNMTLDIFERSVGMLGNNRGLVVADDTYSTSISYHEDTAGIKTRVFVFGKNQATMARYNPTGQLYIDDFSFYMNLQYMTQELIDALTAYRNLVQSQYGVWEALVGRMDAGEDTPALWNAIASLRELLAWRNNFTQEQIKQIAPFIKEETVNINTIEDGRELYRFALRHIRTTAFVPIQISIDVIDVFALEEHQREWLKFRVGDFANIYRKEFNLAYKEMRLISYEHNPIQNSLRLEFSNRDELVTMQWLNNMFFYRLGNMENNWNNERDWYIQIPEFDFNSPEFRDIVQNLVHQEIDNAIEIIIEEIDARTFNQIVEVFETQVLAADTAHILNAWVRYLKVDMLETNFEALDPRIAWPPGAEPFVRYFIRISGITMQHIRATLSPTEVENYITPGYRRADGSWSHGDQIYWTAIGDHPQAFRFFTITDPISVYPGRRVLTNPLPPGVDPPEGYVEIWRDLTEVEKDAIRERFRVKVRRTLNESIRKTDAFEYINNPGSGGGQTMIPKTIWGGGNHVDPNLTRGRGYQYKDWDNFYMTYTTRTGYGPTPAGTEIGIRLRDDGCYYFDVEENDWLRIGSGGGIDEDELARLLETLLGIDLSVIVDGIGVIGTNIILPRLPTQAEINSFPVNAVVLVYDPDNPFVPEE